MTANQRPVAILGALVQRGFLSFAIAVLVICASPLSTFAQDWTLTSAPSNSWSAIAASADLSKIVAAASPGGIYYSLDSGTNWTESNAPTNNWSALASSTNGQFMTGVVNGGGIWVSTNFGASWSQTVAPSNEWLCVANTGDGVTRAAGGLGEVVFSTNSGLDWYQAGVTNEDNGEPLLYYNIVCLAGLSQVVAVSVGSVGQNDWISPTGFEYLWGIWIDGYPFVDQITSATDKSTFLAASGSEILVGNTGELLGGLQFSSPPSLLAASPDASRLIAFDGNSLMYFKEPPSSSWVPFTTLGENIAGAVVSSSGFPVSMLAAVTKGGIYVWQPKGPVIIFQPQSQTVAAATNVELSVGTITTIPLTYKWLFNGVAFETTTNPSLTLSNASPSESGTYSVIASNAFGTEQSSNAVLTILPAIISTESPDLALTCACLFSSVTAVDESTVISFEWGQTTEYGHETPPILLQGPNTWSVSNLITGLIPYATYHFQAVASNDYGVALGGDVSFTTVPKFVQANDFTGWSALVLSEDGHELAATSNEIVCISTNLGVTFTPTEGVGTVFAVSSNGQTILSSTGTNIVFSLDRGVTWSSNATPANVFRFATSSDAQDIVAGNGGSTVFISTNIGATWRSSTAPLGLDSLASSADGSIIYGTAWTGWLQDDPVGYVYKSSITSGSWSTIDQYIAGWATSISCSGNGSVILVNGAPVSISANGGSSWSSPYSFPAIIPPGCVSANGKTLLLTQPFAGPYVSPDSGANLYVANTPSDITGGSVVCSADGRTLGLLAGAIYLSLPPSSQSTQISATISNGVPSFALSGQAGYTYTVQTSTDLISWSNIATVVNTNGSVSFTDPNSTNTEARFYRAIVP